MVTLRVNGVSRQFTGDPNMPLLWYLRDELGLTGSKYGCGTGLCGSCTVHVDGEAMRGCITSLSDADGKSVVTIPGCPANPYNFLGVVLQYATFGTLPELDENNNRRTAASPLVVTGQFCQCIEDPCKFRNCPTGQWCNPNSGQCEDDACVASDVTCPNAADVCRGGTSPAYSRSA